MLSYISDLDYFFLRIQSLFNASLHERKSVIIFDEVQLYPPARQAIKHFVKDQRYDYIETGALLSIKKNVKGSVIENATASRLCELLMDMADSMTVNFSYHANDPSVGFSLHADYDCFKLFLADTGLFVTLAFMDRDYTENVTHEAQPVSCLVIAV